MTLFLRAVALAATLMGVAHDAFAQWTNRYPKNAGFAHHVYLEGYEMPIMAAGVVDPAPSPDGKSIAFASHGFLWLFDVATGEARRITQSGGVDSRPAWSPDGRQLAFVRDDSRTTAVILRDMTSGAEREIDDGMALDPAFAPDGSALFYSNVTAGTLDIWRAELRSGEKRAVTNSAAGIELRPQPHRDGTRLVYLAKVRGGQDEVRLRSLGDGAERVLVAGNLVSQARPALSPDGALIAYNWPGIQGWELRLMSVERPGVSVLLVQRPRGRPLTPAFSSDGKWIYYVESDQDRVMQLWRVSVNGGPASRMAPRRMDWGAPTGRLVVRTRSTNAAVPARLNIRDAGGHPLMPTTGELRFDGQNGLTYFYSNGVAELVVPAGRVAVLAARGLAAPTRSAVVEVAAGATAEVDLDVTPLWDARASGWYSGDHHFHLNYGGQFDLQPPHVLPLLRGEDLDVVTPVLANLHNRFEDQEFWTWKRVDEPPFIKFAQEVRSHFLGHVALFEINELFWPWIWGPGYEVYGRDDRPNTVALLEGRRQGGLNTYVHPVSRPNPFSPDGYASIPVELIADAVLGAVDMIELVCLWSDERGTAEVWYRLLNLGIPIAPEAGTDAMTDFHRTMALGTTRSYVRPEGTFTLQSYMAALRAGRSFATNGPLLDVQVGGMRPGEVLSRGGTSVPFAVDLHTTVPVDSVSVIVNGAVVWSATGVDSSGTRRYTGNIRVPAGGWVAVRATGPATRRWPAMDSYTFAHTAPIWIGSRGSTDAVSARQAARDLLPAFDVAEQRLRTGYAGSEIPNLLAHFAQAREKLQRAAEGR